MENAIALEWNVANWFSYVMEISGYSSPRQDGYLFSYKPGTLTIEPKSLALTGLTATGKTYDGTTTTVLAGIPAITAADIVNGDAVALGVSIRIRF